MIELLEEKTTTVPMYLRKALDKYYMKNIHTQLYTLQKIGEF